MNTAEKKVILRQIVWDYNNITPEKIESVFRGENKLAGHFTREMFF